MAEWAEPPVDDSGEVVRQPRVPGGNNVYGVGGGGGGGVGGFGGAGRGLGVPFAPEGLGAIAPVAMMQQRRRPMVPGVTPGAPMPQDTVPAMLTPGEIVMNPGVTADPRMASLLLAMNMMGAQRMGARPSMMRGAGAMGMPAYRMAQARGMAYGGMVPGYAYGGMVHTMRRMPGGAGIPGAGGGSMTAGGGGFMGGGMMEGYGYGGRVPYGYAMGGMAPGIRQPGPGFAQPAFRTAGMSPMGMAPGMRSAAQNQGGPGRVTSGTKSGDAATLNNGVYSIVDPAGKQSKDYWRDAGGTVRNRNGDVYSYDPNNQWGSYTGSYNPGARGVAERTLGQFGAAGYFDPRGNQMLMDSVRQEALANARASQQGAGLRAQLAGLDPGAAASYSLEAGLRGSSDVARALNNARTQSMLQQQGLANSMLGANQSFGYGLDNAVQQANLQNRNSAEQYNRENNFNFGDFAGNVVGLGVGAFTGGLGKTLGTGLLGGNKTGDKKSN